MKDLDFSLMQIKTFLNVSVLTLLIVLFISSVASAGDKTCSSTFKSYETSTNWMETGFAKKKVALFSTGEASKLTATLEAKMTKEGIDAIILKDPNPSDIDTLFGRDGYLFGPLFVARRKQTRDLFEEINQREDLTGKQKRKRRDTLKRKLKKTDEESDYKISLSEITENDLLSWLNIFSNTVAKKEFGVQTVNETIIKNKVLDTPKNSSFQVLIHHKVDGLVGGLFFDVIEGGSVAKVWRAAFKDEHKQANLGLRSFYEMTKFSLEREIPKLSYGTDPNFYGELSGLGLQKYKSELGFGVEPGELLATPRFLKILKPESFKGAVSFALKDKTDASSFVAHVYGELPHDHKLPKDIEVIFED